MSNAIVPPPYGPSGNAPPQAAQQQQPDPNAYAPAVDPRTLIDPSGQYPGAKVNPYALRPPPTYMERHENVDATVKWLGGLGKNRLVQLVAVGVAFVATGGIGGPIALAVGAAVVKAAKDINHHKIEHRKEDWKRRHDQWNVDNKGIEPHENNPQAQAPWEVPLGGTMDQNLGNPVVAGLRQQVTDLQQAVNATAASVAQMAQHPGTIPNTVIQGLENQIKDLGDKFDQALHVMQNGGQMPTAGQSQTPTSGQTQQPKHQQNQAQSIDEQNAFVLTEAIALKNPALGKYMDAVQDQPTKSGNQPLTELEVLAFVLVDKDPKAKAAVSAALGEILGDETKPDYRAHRDAADQLISPTTQLIFPAKLQLEGISNACDQAILTRQLDRESASAIIQAINYTATGRALTQAAATTGINNNLELLNKLLEPSSDPNNKDREKVIEAMSHGFYAHQEGNIRIHDLDKHATRLGQNRSGLVANETHNGISAGYTAAADLANAAARATGQQASQSATKAPTGPVHGL